MDDFWPLLTCAEAGDFERELLTDEAAEWNAMQAAGRALGRAVRRDFTWWRPWPEEVRLLVLAGKGHNAGDALLAAAELAAERSRRVNVTVVWAFGAKDLKPLLARSRERLHRVVGEPVRELEWSRHLPERLAAEAFDLTLEGIGGWRLQGAWRKAGGGWAGGAHGRGAALGLRGAVDLWAGMGDASGGPIFRADVTYGTGLGKAPVLAEGAVAHTGRVRLLDLGFFAGAQRERFSSHGWTAAPTLLRAQARLREATTDKRHYGHVFVLGGARRYPGAVLMAASAAVRAGAGLTTVCAPDPLVPALAGALPEAMWHPLPGLGEGALDPAGVGEVLAALDRRSVLLVGPGLPVNESNTRFLRDLVAGAGVPLVLDAGALQPELREAIEGRTSDQGAVVLTPHLGEYLRLQEGRVEGFVPDELRAFARRLGAIVVLKGPVTRVTDGERLVSIAAGNPVLARGGSGDLLGGILAARLAVRRGDPLRAAAEAVAWHGAAADDLARAQGEVAVRTSDLLDHLGPVLRELAS